jgi:hypothetical protein
MQSNVAGVVTARFAQLWIFAVRAIVIIFPTNQCDEELL